MDWYGGLDESWRWGVRLALLSLWQSLGFAAVLLAGRRPVIVAPAYGLAATVPFVAMLAMPREEMPLWLFFTLVAAIFAVGLHFFRHIRLALHYGDFIPHPHLWRAGPLCAIPVLGPVLSLLVVAVVRLIRWRDRLYHFD